jgi:Cu(I)/Ag(I) efflux system membrane fusion protein
VNQTGQRINAGSDLALLYSPELATAVQTLLDAKRTNSPEMLAINKERLRLWGILPDQIQEILRSGKKITHLKIRSPMAGQVYKKYVQEGQYVDEGMPLFDLVDLSTVWLQVQVYEDDLAFLPPQRDFADPTHPPAASLTASATTLAFPNEIFTGKLTFVLPHLDQDTRTVAARFELPNPQEKLRPGTSATVKINIPPANLPALQAAVPQDHSDEQALLQNGLVLAVPDSAVIDTGSQKIVYRETGPVEFEGVLVKLGPRLTGPDGVPYYPVLSGLKEGDQVVTAGSFLVDAETRLNPATGSIYFGGSSGSKGGTSGVTTVQPSTPVDKDAQAAAGLKQLSSLSDREVAKTQGYCAVQTGNRLGTMGAPFKLLIEGHRVFLCCEGCSDEALAHPRQTLATAERLRKAKAKHH